MRGIHGALAGGHREVQEEVIVAAQEFEDGVGRCHVGRLDEDRGEDARQERCGCHVPVVALVTHLERLGGDGLEVDGS